MITAKRGVNKYLAPGSVFILTRRLSVCQGYMLTRETSSCRCLVIHSSSSQKIATLLMIAKNCCASLYRGKFDTLPILVNLFKAENCHASFIRKNLTRLF